MLRLLLICAATTVSCSFAALAEAPVAEIHWLSRAGGAGADKTRGLATDADGNSYLTGEFSGKADFGDFTLTSRGDLDIFIAKYDADGRCLWAQQAGGLKVDRGYGIAVDESGNLCVTGHYESEDAVFGGDTSIPNAGEYSVFFARYDGEGDLLWVRHGGSAGYDTAHGVTVGRDGRCYFTGGLRGPGEIAGEAMPSGSRAELFIACFDGEGKLEWLRSSSGPGNAQGRGVALDGEGNLLLAGFGGSGKKFGSMTLPAGSQREPFVISLDPMGETRWSWHGGGSTDGLATAVAVDGAGGAYLAGMFKGTLRCKEDTFTSRGESDFYVLRIDSSGQPLWCRRGGGMGIDYGLGMVAGREGDCYLTGEMTDTITVDTGAEPIELTGHGKRDLYVAKYSGDGALRGITRSGGEFNDLSYCIGVDGKGNAHVSGAFDASTRHGRFTATARGRNDIFLLKLTP